MSVWLLNSNENNRFLGGKKSNKQLQAGVQTGNTSDPTTDLGVYTKKFVY